MKFYMLFCMQAKQTSTEQCLSLILLKIKKELGFYQYLTLIQSLRTAQLQT